MLLPVQLEITEAERPVTEERLEQDFVLFIY